MNHAATMPSDRPSAFKRWVAIAVVIAVLDQLSKLAITHNMALGDYVVVTDFFNIVRLHNHGAAFSFLADHGGWQRWFLAAIALLASVWITFMLKAHQHERAFAFSLCLILGGAVGNLIDRVRLGYVVDFLDVHWSWLSPLFYQGHFPAFNVADSAITVGATWLILDELRRLLRRSPSRPTP